MYNEINCEVIRDLLPPYAYGLANPATCALVDGHLETCEPCNQALEQLRSEEEAAPPPPGEALGRVKKKIKRKKLRNALMSVIAAIAVLCTGFYFLVVRDYPVPYREGDIQVDRRNEEGKLEENGHLGITDFRANHHMSCYGPIEHFYADGSVLVVYFVQLRKHPALQAKLLGPITGAADGEWQGSMWINEPPSEDGRYILKVKPPKVTCRVYYAEDFGKLRPKGSTRVANRLVTELPLPAESPLPYELSEEVLKYCTLIWEGDITPE